MSSSPPFQIVHANKAFSVLSGISASKVLGRPIESILKQSQMCINSTQVGCCDSYFDTVLDCSCNCATSLDQKLYYPQKHTDMACHGHLVPIVDRSKSAKLNPNHEAVITHLMFQLKDKAASKSGFSFFSRPSSTKVSSLQSFQCVDRNDSIGKGGEASSSSRGDSLSPLPPSSRRLIG